MPSIEYDSESFPSGSIPNGNHQLSVTWDDILWAAITVGRPDLYHVFEHGHASIYEALFRWSLIRMSLEQHGYGTRIHRTAAFKHMDPSEKGSVNYFLGLVMCKLFSTKLLNAPWCWHLDVWRDDLDPVLLKGRSRPDMVAQSASSNQWHAFECKGRASTPGTTEKNKAKQQAQRIVSVGGTNCTLHVGTITYFRGDVLKFFWKDPEAKSEPIEIPRPGDIWGRYYAPFIEAYLSRTPDAESTLTQGVSIEELDLTLKIHPQLSEPLFGRNWVSARRRARELRKELKNEEYQPDGLKVVAGTSWRSRFEERIRLR